MKYRYIPSQICPSSIEVEMDGDVLKDVCFEGGCNGNLQGLSALVKGCTYAQLREKLSGIHCGMNDTSCPDQLVRAIEAAMNAAETSPSET